MQNCSTIYSDAVTWLNIVDELHLFIEDEAYCNQCMAVMRSIASASMKFSTKPQLLPECGDRNQGLATTERYEKAMQQASSKATNMISERLPIARDELRNVVSAGVGGAALHAKPVGTRMGAAKAWEHALKTIGALRQEDLEVIVDKKTRAQEVAARAKILDAAAQLVYGEMGG